SVPSRCWAASLQFILVPARQAAFGGRAQSHISHYSDRFYLLRRRLLVTAGPIANTFSLLDSSTAFALVRKLVRRWYFGHGHPWLVGDERRSSVLIADLGRNCNISARHRCCTLYPFNQEDARNRGTRCSPGNLG